MYVLRNVLNTFLRILLEIVLHISAQLEINQMHNNLLCICCCSKRKTTFKNVKLLLRRFYKESPPFSDDSGSTPIYKSENFYIAFKKENFQNYLYFFFKKIIFLFAREKFEGQDWILLEKMYLLLKFDFEKKLIDQGWNARAG